MEVSHGLIHDGYLQGVGTNVLECIISPLCLNFPFQVDEQGCQLETRVLHPLLRTKDEDL